MTAQELIKRIHGNDELLGENVTEEIAKKAIEWLNFFAKKLKVNKNSIKDSFIVEKLLEAYAFREVCIKKSYGLNAPFGKTRGNEEADYYGKKLLYYEKQIEKLEKTITAEDLVRGEAEIEETKPYKSYRAVNVMRG